MSAEGCRMGLRAKGWGGGGVSGEGWGMRGEGWGMRGEGWGMRGEGWGVRVVQGHICTHVDVAEVCENYF